MKTHSRAPKSVLVPAAPYLALFAAGAILATLLLRSLPGPGAILLVALVVLRVGVMLSAVRGAPGEGPPEGARIPARRAALHAAHV